MLQRGWIKVFWGNSAKNNLLSKKIVFCQKTLPKTIVCCQKTLPKTIFCQKRWFFAKKRCQKRSFVAKNDHVCCQKTLPKAIVCCQKQSRLLPKTIICRQKTLSKTIISCQAFLMLQFTGESRMGQSRMTHFPAFQLAYSFILIGWAILEKVVLPYISAILRKKPRDN